MSIISVFMSKACRDRRGEQSFENNQEGRLVFRATEFCILRKKLDISCVEYFITETQKLLHYTV